MQDSLQMTIFEDADYISCSSGGNRGFMYIGVIAAFEDVFHTMHSKTWSDYVSTIKGFTGTSAGAIFALCLLLNRTSKEMKEECWQLMSSLRAIGPCPDVAQFASKYGFDNGDTIRKHISNLLIMSGLSADTTFGDLKRLTQKEFICVATNLRTKSLRYFGPQTTPYLRVVDGVFMSMCVPFMFSPFEHEGDLYVDGFLCANIPDVFPFEKTLYICVDHNKRQNPIESWSDYIEALFTSAVSTSDIEKKLLDMSCDRCLKLRMPKMMQDEFSMKLDVHHVALYKFINCGYSCAMSFLYPLFMETMISLFRWVIPVFVEIKRVAFDVDEAYYLNLRLDAEVVQCT
jgi:predicted acylesterase/phospholipase RssA